MLNTCDLLLCAPAVLEAGVCPYFLAVPDHGHVLWSRVMDVFIFRHLGHHGLVLDLCVSDSGVVRPALLAPGRVVTDTQSSHGLEARSSNGAPLRHHTCSRSRHPAPLTQD
jgi:hypothetical protein